MKLKLLLITLLTSVSLFAGSLNDNANLLGNQDKERLANDIANTSVSIITYNSVPNDDLKTYADSMASQFASNEKSGKSFVILVTTHPRAWRISMYPSGFVGGEATRQIGDAMVYDFKQGYFYSGLRNAAFRLNSLTTPSQSQIVATSNNQSQAVQQVVVTGSRERENDNFTVIFFVIVFGLIIFSGIVYAIHRSNVKRKEEEAEEARLEKERAERYAKLQEEEAKAFKLKQEKQKKALSAMEKEVANMSESDKKKALESWKSYPASAREQIVNQYYNSSYYHGGILSDPLYFYLFLTMVAPNHTTYVPPAPQPSSDSSSSYRHSSSSSDDSYYRSSSSSSDSFGSSGGWDSSSSSSFGSFSDSSGSGGSW